MKYRATVKGAYALPQEVYMQVVYLIKDYDRMVEQAEGILESSGGGHDRSPQAEHMSDTTAVKSMRRETLLRKIKAVDDAFNSVPEEYRESIRANIINRVRYPDYASRATFWRYRKRVAWRIAKSLDMI